MKKEHFKNLVLVALIITNFMLSQRIFANKKLWLFGYNFFANMGNNLKNDDLSTTLHLAVPEKIYVNTGYQSSRFNFLRTQDSFEEIYSYVEPIIQSAFSAPIKNISEVSEDAWHSVLSGKSIYLVYGCDYSSSIYSELIGIKQTNLSVSSFSHLAINEDGSIFIKDNKNNSYHRITTTSTNIKTVIEQIMTENDSVESIINYSYELNFDKEFGDQKTFISPLVAVYSSPVESNTVISENPIIRSNEANTPVIERILSAFSINPNTVRRYTEADGTLVFVENNGVLRISQDGVLNFTANDTGIELSGENTSLVSLARFVDSINAACNSKNEMTVTSSVTQDSQDYTFDYLVQGFPVKFEERNAVSAKVSGGYLKEYTHILRKYINTQTPIIAPSFIEALDNTILSYQDSMKEIHIMKMYPAYNDNLISTEIGQDWYIEINDVIAQ